MRVRKNSPKEQLALSAVLIVAVGLGSGSAVCQEHGVGTGGGTELAGVTRLLQWRDPGGELRAEGLVLMEWREDSLHNRILIQPDHGTRFILDRVQYPLVGKTKSRLLEETSGWWAEVDEATNLRLEEVGDLAKPAVFAARFIEEERRIQVTIEAAGGLSYTGSEVEWGDTVYSDLVRELQTESFSSRLVRVMPAALRRGIRSLDALSGAQPVDGSLVELRHLLGVLRAALDAHEPVPEQLAARQRSAEISQWTLEYATGHPGAQLTETEEQRLAARFLTVDPAQPMGKRDSGRFTPDNGG